MKDVPRPAPARPPSTEWLPASYDQNRARLASCRQYATGSEPVQQECRPTYRLLSKPRRSRDGNGWLASLANRLMWLPLMVRLAGPFRYSAPRRPLISWPCKGYTLDIVLIWWSLTLGVGGLIPMLVGPALREALLLPQEVGARADPLLGSF